MNFHKFKIRKETTKAGFTLIEAIVAISVLGIGVASTIGALTKFNALAATSRNSSGAYTVVMNQIDLFESMAPFNPQKTNLEDGTPQIPKDTMNSYPTYDMNLTAAGTWRSISVDGTSYNVPIYQYKDPTTGSVVVVTGQLQIQVTDLSATIPNTYQAVVRATYTYLGKPYSFSMSALRTSDI